MAEERFEGKPVFNVFKGIDVAMNPRMARDLVDLLFEIENLDSHLFALAEQINNKLPDAMQVEHPSVRKAAS